LSLNYCLLAVEGVHDQAAITKILQLSGFNKFDGEKKQLDPFWAGFIPIYPNKSGRLYMRLDMPSILTSTTHSVAIYAGEGSNLIKNIVARVGNYPQYAEDIQAFGLIVDADRKSPTSVAAEKAKGLKIVFPTLSDKPGVITTGPPRTGIYILPDNKTPGVLDSILTECASLVYPDHKKAAETFISSLENTHTQHFRPFDNEKALIASIVSILRPGMANTPSIAGDEWINDQTISAIEGIKLLHTFIKNLLNLEQ
jgi:hypothetical protein